MDTPVYDSAGTGASADALSLNVPYPSTVIQNNLLLCHVTQRDSTHPVNTPSGWDVISSMIDNTFTIVAYLYGKIATGSESGNLALTCGGSGTISIGARIYQVRGNATTSYYESVSNAGIGDATSTIFDADVRTLGPGRLALNFISDSGVTGIGDFTGETGGDWTEAVAEYTDGAITPTVQIQLQQAAMPIAGFIGGGSMASGGGQYITIGVAIKPFSLPISPQLRSYHPKPILRRPIGRR